MNVNKVLTKDYENKTLGGCGKNKANSKPIKANLLNAQMNVNKVLTKDYENKSNWAICENKPNIKPKQTQTNPTCSELVEPISKAKNAANLYPVRSSCNLCWKKLLFRVNTAHKS